MKVFVVGGTGAIGGHAVPALVRAGHTVTALARTPEKAAQLTRSLRASNARFRQASGWTPMYPSAREGWIATALG
jgi:uncharacterized protein YbjT (DUF2867 family)